MKSTTAKESLLPLLPYRARSGQFARRPTLLTQFTAPTSLPIDIPGSQTVSDESSLASSVTDASTATSPVSTQNTESFATSPISIPVPLAPPPSPIQQIPRRRMTSVPQTVPIFSGDEEEKAAVQPSNFMQLFRIDNRTATDTERIETFELYLAPDSPAELWFSKLDPADRATWAALQAAFTLRFPGIKKAVKGERENEQELTALRLTDAVLGLKEDYMGVSTWSHIAFAERLLTIAKRMDLLKRVTLINTVRQSLPRIVRELVGSNHANWQAFYEAIKTIDIDSLQDGVSEAKKRSLLDQQQSARTLRLEQLVAAAGNAPPSPTSAIRSQMASTSISQPASRATTANPFVASAGGTGNLFGAAPRSAATPPAGSTATGASIQALVDKYPLQQRNPAGIAVYAQQIAAWKLLYPTGRVEVTTGYPLRPGGSPVNSRECYRCGKGGHVSLACPVDPADQISRQEQFWRSLASKHLRAASYTNNYTTPLFPVSRPAGTNHVAIQYTVDELWVEQQSNPGNGSGSSG